MFQNLYFSWSYNSQLVYWVAKFVQILAWNDYEDCQHLNFICSQEISILKELIDYDETHLRWKVVLQWQLESTVVCNLKYSGTYVSALWTLLCYMTEYKLEDLPDIAKTNFSLTSFSIGQILYTFCNYNIAESVSQI